MCSELRNTPRTSLPYSQEDTLPTPVAQSRSSLDDGEPWRCQAALLGQHAFPLVILSSCRARYSSRALFSAHRCRHPCGKPPV